MQNQMHTILRLKRQTETLNLTLEATLERLSEVEKEVGGVLEARECESDSSPDSQRSEDIRTEDAEESAGNTSSLSASSPTSSSSSSSANESPDSVRATLTAHQPDAYDISLSSDSEAPQSLQPLRYADIVKSKQALLAKKPTSAGSKAAAEKKQPLKSAGAKAPIKKRKVKE